MPQPFDLSHLNMFSEDLSETEKKKINISLEELAKLKEEKVKVYLDQQWKDIESIFKDVDIDPKNLLDPEITEVIAGMDASIEDLDSSKLQDGDIDSDQLWLWDPGHGKITKGASGKDLLNIIGGKNVSPASREYIMKCFTAWEWIYFHKRTLKITAVAAGAALGVGLVLYRKRKNHGFVGDSLQELLDSMPKYINRPTVGKINRRLD